MQEYCCPYEASYEASYEYEPNSTVIRVFFNKKKRKFKILDAR